MNNVNLNRADFIKSAADSGSFIYSSKPVIAFAGKSNVGKSSVINRILNRKKLAYVGNTPGKTVHVNYYSIDDKVFFADLPGYGYAKVGQTEKERWAKLMEKFFASPDTFKLGVLILDSRHKPTADDVQMCNWFIESGVPLIIVANKIDKLKKSEISDNISSIRTFLSLPEHFPLIPFSAETGFNREKLINEIFQTV